MKYLRKLIAACALLAMLCPALAEETTYEPLPWLDSTGRKLLAAPYLPNPDCYLPDQGGYHDDSLDIRVETSYWTQDIERVDEPGEGTTTVMAVYVKITDPTQIRTALASPYPSKNTERRAATTPSSPSTATTSSTILKESSIATRTVCVNCPANTATR